MGLYFDCNKIHLGISFCIHYDFIMNLLYFYGAYNDFNGIHGNPLGPLEPQESIGIL